MIFFFFIVVVVEQIPHGGGYSFSLVFPVHPPLELCLATLLPFCSLFLPLAPVSSGSSSLSSKAVLVRQLSLWAAGEVDGGFVLLVAVDVLEVDHHVQGISQDEEQDQRCHQAHQDGWREEGGAVTG